MNQESEFLKLCETKVVFESVITIGEVLDGLGNLPLDELLVVIKQLELQCENWDVTEQLLNHFLNQFITVFEEEEPSDVENFISIETRDNLKKLLKLSE